MLTIYLGKRVMRDDDDEEGTDAPPKKKSGASCRNRVVPKADLLRMKEERKKAMEKKKKDKEKNKENEKWEDDNMWSFCVSRGYLSGTDTTIRTKNVVLPFLRLRPACPLPPNLRSSGTWHAKKEINYVALFLQCGGILSGRPWREVSQRPGSLLSLQRPG